MNKKSPAERSGHDLMQVDEIMKNYKPVYPDSGLWEDTFQMIRECPADYQLVQDLLADLERSGEFREPIVLRTYEAYLEANAEYKHLEGESIDPYVPYVNNGTHRVYAHFLSEHKEVKVQFGWKPETEEHYPFLASRIAFPPDLDEERIYELFDRFRSFKLTDDIWMESELVSINYNNFHIIWVFGLKKVEELLPLTELINAKTLSLTEEMGIVCTAKIGIINSEEEDDFFFDRKPLKL
jgi:hypothetical protein